MTNDQPLVHMHSKHPLFYLKDASAQLLYAVAKFHGDINTEPFDIDDADSAIDAVLEAFNKVEKSVRNLKDRNR